MNELGIALRKSALKSTETIGKALAEYGFTERMTKAQEDELNSVDCKTMCDFYFCWAQRGMDEKCRI